MKTNDEIETIINVFKDAYHDSYLPDAVEDFKYSFNNLLKEAAQYLENVSEDLQKGDEKPKVNIGFDKESSTEEYKPSSRDEKLDTYHLDGPFEQVERELRKRLPDFFGDTK